ncbi:hypothetical protein NBRC111894_2951 [Sporolactobacillus inulinus]|uniref:Uncharacterized protein n=1 Tax=Sporolactobacillus inulinus TaxID=2078 RepID=A0A4Y1ZE47_9BACL|nr:hypothetical protein NBRC111894_2951 [Sporolactobacillus inulinus]
MDLSADISLALLPNTPSALAKEQRSLLFCVNASFGDS